MSEFSYTVAGNAAELPDAWDILADSYYKRREFLSHCERFNPCGQRYHLMRESSRLRAGAIVYTLKFDLLTFLGIRSPIAMHVVGVPCSVSASGIVGEGRFGDEILSFLLKEGRGLHVCLNLDSALARGPVATGRTLPSIVFENHFDSWEEYLAALRSPYRRRMRKILDVESRLDVRTGPCSGYTEEMHAQYLSVLDQSKGKLERLTMEFFRNLPGAFRLTTFLDQGKVRGWVITLMDGDRLSFFLGGQDYSWEPGSLYLVQLLAVLRRGLALRAAEIDLGQTAEVPKLRIGGALREKIMLGHHHAPALDWLLRRTIGMLSYHPRFPDPHTFRSAPG